MSILGLILELVSYSITMMYNYTNGYSMITYLEYPILLIQEYVLIFVVLKYKNLLNQKVLLYSGFYFMTLAAFAIHLLPASLLVLLVVSIILTLERFV